MDNKTFENLFKYDDYDEMCKSKEYRMAAFDLFGSCMNLNKMYPGHEFTIRGDLTRISIFGNNNINLQILFGFYDINSPRYATVSVPRDMQQFVREKLYTDTGIVLRVSWVYSDFIDSFTLKEVKEHSTDRLFGECVCEKCGYKYGYNKSVVGMPCQICGDDSKIVYDYKAHIK